MGVRAPSQGPVRMGLANPAAIVAARTEPHGHSLGAALNADPRYIVAQTHVHLTCEVYAQDQSRFTDPP
jgi:hypothetical protein